MPQRPRPQVASAPMFTRRDVTEWHKMAHFSGRCHLAHNCSRSRTRWTGDRGTCGSVTAVPPGSPRSVCPGTPPLNQNFLSAVGVSFSARGAFIESGICGQQAVPCKYSRWRVVRHGVNRTSHSRCYWPAPFDPWSPSNNPKQLPIKLRIFPLTIRNPSIYMPPQSNRPLVRG